ncbi:MarR family winged helix-turn-helix transcriptional regulator [Mediterraneibacter agrestimuris]|uniref:MarR family winged helix-turn-helix transcriptional regulator n=1 Tax=Mediterraneibacter agrestimuris TaxID=2941333 RepID=UPI00203E3856|nr:MarR family winged helix-turn-helix transcriptional regulator [Mediterraneibacter agrestimuris]
MSGEKCNSVGFVIRRLDHVLRQNLEMCVKEEGIDEITLMHGWILRYLYENQDQDIFQKDIEKNFSIGRSTVTGIIQILEKKGFINREFVAHDARLKKVTLTQKGMDSHRKIEEQITCQNRKMTEGVNPQDLQIFLQVAAQIRMNLESDRRTEGKTVR